MKQSAKKGLKNQIGALGEAVAAHYLSNKGFSIIDTNYLKKWGEIDIIAKQGSVIHFVEVKAVSHRSRSELEQAVLGGGWDPEEQVHANKLKKLVRVIETWLLEQNYAGEWQIDVVAVRMVPEERFASVKYLENIVVK